MNPSRLFILRPVATVLMMVAVLFAGMVAYRMLSTSALPEVDYPTIQVTTLYPGASATVLATSVTALEIVDGRGERGDADRCAAFGLHGDVPDRQRREPLEFVGLERWPVDDGRLVRVVCIEQHAAEHLPVRIGTDPDRTLTLEGPVAHGVICRCMLFLQRVGHGCCYAITRRKILA